MRKYRLHGTGVFDNLVDLLTEEMDGADAVLRKRRITGWPLPSPADGSLPKMTTDKSSRWFDAEDQSGDFITSSTVRALDIATIQDELGLAPGLTLDDIAVLRRRFAARNHPDKVAAELRELATRRMMIANALCDTYPVSAFATKTRDP